MYVIRPVRSHLPLALAAVRSPTNVNRQRPFHHHHHYHHDQHRYTTTTAIATTRAQSSPTKPPVQAKTFSRRFHDIAARSARPSKPAEPSPLPPHLPKVVAQSPHERRNLQPPTSPQTVLCGSTSRRKPPHFLLSTRFRPAVLGRNRITVNLDWASCDSPSLLPLPLLHTTLSPPNAAIRCASYSPLH
ncbi:hypothetical protein BGZ61DRAFT_182075 [Ilyonectria robusta]|uniref:uncharacterized protein n=1 Tax=Ilyonectria robusta TaxID=1079257 RepID=UPI001E8DA64E|nr:uncharacterized protein BGZ61DRAFT_182075 [Ilyonectria robusta]KAH8729443.1 hypothetical protein BGZ61DRAFT_182075 [Ilyonectria robusta]